VRDTVAVAAFSVVFVALLAAAEAASRRWKLGPELARKSAHVSSAAVAATMPWFMSFPAVAVLALLFVPFMLVSRRLDLFPAVHSVERSTWGEMWFPLGVAVVAIAVPDRGPYAFGVLVMGLSDAAASIIGQRYGNRAFRIVGAWKTYAGSATFFVTTLVLTFAALALTGGLSAASVPMALGVSGALTAVEAALGGGTDNLFLPVVAAGLLSLLTAA
jgi:phytol kinase